MAKFKVGNFVWVKPKGELCAPIGTVFSTNVYSYCGKRLRISYAYHDNHYVLNDAGIELHYNWMEEWLESEEEHQKRVEAGKLEGSVENNSQLKKLIECVHDVFKKQREERIRMNIPKSVIFNNPATIVFWKDGSKTISKAHNEAFDPEKGLAICYAKKALGDGYEASKKFDRIVKKYLPKAKETDDDEPKVNPAVELVEQLNDLERHGVVLSRAKKYKFDDGQVVQFSKKIDCWVISLDK